MKDQNPMPNLTHADIWDADAARTYDTPGRGMFADDLLKSTVDRLAELAAGRPALEFAIGTGRVAIPLRERGVPVSGIEISQAMTDRLHEKIDADELPVAIGDMSKTTVSGRFGLVFLVYNGISNVLSQAEQVATFENAARHLEPGGCFVVENWVPDLRSLPPGQEATVFAAEPGYIGLDTIDTMDQIVVSHHFRFAEDSRTAELFRSPHRYVWPSELDLMGQLAGFALESRHADWTGSAFTAESRSHVSVYRLEP
ncbi:class I SAM-dependent DNA methyltransferase [Devosia sp.]|uniref:class I SAM-dependent DNA methyltransferase n=1 Tax=Devosia sp. TaxID=1871048 RepID=UPI003A8DBACE